MEIIIVNKKSSCIYFFSFLESGAKALVYNEVSIQICSAVKEILVFQSSENATKLCCLNGL